MSAGIRVIRVRFFQSAAASRDVDSRARASRPLIYARLASSKFNWSRFNDCCARKDEAREKMGGVPLDGSPAAGSRDNERERRLQKKRARNFGLFNCLTSRAL